ncbi:enoyl-CoA hydratase/isomerase family protein [Bacillus alkalicellulosilyticus]|uniref:enoyl-CoA hydratase/isomerase family protein n=1 Tax=Alkalihalobacterium alkalicellulosilyticum TaxID=1912214 RepID=UPI000996446E|nr:enoyl-CoA hydratase/isomerase family protein [Bacillus alkalicellulosilyticus]
MGKVTVSRNNDIVWVTINRPDKRNAIDYDVMVQLDCILTEIEQNENDKVLIITGAGDRAFCSGGDLSIFHSLHTKEKAQEMLERMANILYRLFLFPKITIAAVNGVAVGGGCEIAVACDFRLASPNARLGFIQATLGITTGWGGSSMLLERIESQKALQFLFSAEIVTAKEAEQKGLVTDLVNESDFRVGCEEWVLPFIKQSVPVLQAYKKRWLDQIDRDELKKRFAAEVDECSTLWESEEHQEAVKKFLKK